MKAADFDLDITPGQLEPTEFVERRFTGTRIEHQKVRGVGFVPNPLPPDMDLGDLLVQTYDALVAAERQLSLLSGVARDLDNPFLLIGPFITREAKLSSAIENTFASGSNLALFDLDPNTVEPQNRQEVLEVGNYVKALRYGHLSDLPICRRLLLKMHKILLTGVEKDAGVPGQFRKSQNAIGQKQDRFADAKFVPTPPQFLEEAIDKLERFINSNCDLPRLIQFALVHYQFEAIHPFDDGNGRLGRLLIALQLCKQAQLDAPLVYISGFFEQNREAYYERLYRVSTHCEWLEWIKFFLTAIVTQAEDAHVRARRLLDLRQKYLERVREKRASGMLPVVIDKLFEHPALTVAAVQRLTELTAPSAGKLIKKLLDKGIIREATGRQRKRVYIAPEIIEVMEI